MKKFYAMLRRMVLIIVACGLSGFLFGQIAINSVAEFISEIEGNMGGNYKLTTDIDFSGTGFSGFTSTFTGTLDGDGYALKNISIKKTEGSVGIFSTTNGATIKNLIIDNAIIEVVYVDHNQDFAGILVAKMNGGTIEQCAIVNSSISGRGHVGAFVGNLRGNDAKVENCYSSAMVKGLEWVGGIVGLIEKDDTNITIEKCCNTGTVTNTAQGAGGIVGRNENSASGISIQYNVNLAAEITGAAHCHRILGSNGGSGLNNNYSLASTRLENSESSSQSLNGRNGADITGGDANAKTAVFFTGLGWNLTDTWSIDENTSYPTLKIVQDKNMLLLNNQLGLSLELPETSLPLDGITRVDGISDAITFSSGDPDISITGTTLSYTGSTPAQVGVTATSGVLSTLFYITFPEVIKITNATELASITQSPGKKFVLMNDIDMTGTTFSGLCSGSAPFTGTFDGNGHKIIGLSFESTTESAGESQIGLFRKIQNATIRNLGLEHVNFTGRENVGGIAGIADGGLIEQCFVVNSVITAFDRAAGIAGLVLGGVVIKNCYVNAVLESNDNQAGGIAGASQGNATIENCYFAGSVTGAGGNFKGAMLGLLDAEGITVTIKNCLNLATEISGRSPRRIASIVGRDTEADFSNNYTISTTTGVADGVAKENGNNLPDNTDAKSSTFYTSTLSWDFTNVWTIDDGNAYPTLRMQKSQVLPLSGYRGLCLNTTGTLDLTSITRADGSNAAISFSSNGDLDLTDPAAITYTGTTTSLTTATITASSTVGGIAGVQTSFEITVLPVMNLANEADLALVTRYPMGNFLLIDDITMSGSGSAGLCSGSAPFTGTFDGNGYKIMGLNFESTTESDGESQIGLFRKIKGATIRDLGLTNILLKGRDNVAGIAGEADGGLIEQCYVINSTIEAHDRAAGIAGLVQGGVVIKNCYVDATLKASAQQAGGIAGASKGDVTIENCYFAGSITGGNHKGAMLGLLDAEGITVTIKNCLNLATAISDGNPRRIAAIIGRSTEADFSNNYSINSTTGVGNGDDKENGTLLSDDAEAKSLAFYTSMLGWDFTDVWTIDDGNAYPVFKALGTVWNPQNSSTDWTARENWRNSRTPGVTGNVVIPVSSSYPEITTNTTVGGLTMDFGAQVNITGTATKLTASKVSVNYPVLVKEWEPIGFPVDINGINCLENGVFNQEWETTLLVPHDPEDEDKGNGNFWLKSYDGENNKFDYCTQLPAAGVSYIIQFPDDYFLNLPGTVYTAVFDWDLSNVFEFENVTSVDVSQLAEGEYKLIANIGLNIINVQDNTPADVYYYKYYKNDNHFKRTHGASVSINPFEAFIVTKQSGGTPTLRAFVALEDDGPASFDATPVVNDPVIETYYYTLQGIVVTKPSDNLIYLVKELHESGKITIRKSANFKRINP